MTDEEVWNFPPRDLSLSAQKIHVWRANLEESEERVQDLLKVLSLDERNRADRFRFEHHRNHFIVGRGILRSLLSSYLHIAPEALKFSYGERGKPELINLPNSDNNHQKLHFNLAHSQGLALYAIGDRPVGIDLEQIRSVSDLEALTRRFFSASEYTAISALSAQQQPTAFFRYWTCKEAYLKATGEGLAKLKELEISLSSQLLSSPSTQFVNVPTGTIADWHLQELVPATGFVGAIVTTGQNLEIDRWQF
ncbi:MAG: 4'-phosphopantetheinyl transferase superfamily protein [Leptolyngbyaceae cyanobacterium CSU_1_3]|nr:4'-phosphopantetheinyl transferase superfamily protein [Leptolyngbyaceae cyanobacterium CSU_1_3]